ncbi:UNVERIFIED_CONTAM: hypothetical protein Sradi_7038200 [Sesamum radiatum]|uniref:CCHC-type domain-containing protein n=1 Tax=Sesamum radiatum TaxID=300843 RepID=A0AAW2J9L3_SESRA
MMNLGVASLIENRLGALWDLEMDETGCSLGASSRIRVSLNIHRPLKRVRKIRSMMGMELLMQFIYECLPNFCYLCGRLGHIDKYCELRFEAGYRDSEDELPYGPWLRVPAQVEIGLWALRLGGCRWRETLARHALGPTLEQRLLGILDHRNKRNRKAFLRRGIHVASRLTRRSIGASKTDQGEYLNPILVVPDKYTGRSGLRRGRRPGRGVRGCLRKMSNGVPVLEDDDAFVMVLRDG